jgi:hypothetical protein
MLINEDKLELLWRWFVQNEYLIKNAIEQELSIEQEYLIDQLNNLILEFGRLTWDIGMDEQNNWFFTISPNGNQDLVELTEHIIEAAPRHLDWIFYAGKPQKNWERTFSLYDHEMDVVEIDANSWYYVAFLEADGTVELIIEANNIKHLDPETIEIAGNLFLVHELGEKMSLQIVSKVTLVPQLNPDDAASKYPIADLKEHLGL